MPKKLQQIVFVRTENSYQVLRVAGKKSVRDHIAAGNLIVGCWMAHGVPSKPQDFWVYFKERSARNIIRTYETAIRAWVYAQGLDTLEPRGLPHFRMMNSTRRRGYSNTIIHAKKVEGFTDPLITLVLNRPSSSIGIDTKDAAAEFLKSHGFTNGY